MMLKPSVAPELTRSIIWSATWSAVHDDLMSPCAGNRVIKLAKRLTTITRQPDQQGAAAVHDDVGRQWRSGSSSAPHLKLSGSGAQSAPATGRLALSQPFSNSISFSDCRLAQPFCSSIGFS